MQAALAASPQHAAILTSLISPGITPTALPFYCLTTLLASAHITMMCPDHLGRSQDSQAMADRITDEVNAILCQEPGAPTLSKQAVLDLIDQGASQGGPQAGPAYHPTFGLTALM